MDNLQDKSKKESIIRGQAFQELIRTDGWKYVKLYFETKVQALATALLVEDKPIIEFESQRQELVGLRKLLGFIDSDIKTLEDENKATRTTEDK